MDAMTYAIGNSANFTLKKKKDKSMVLNCEFANSVTTDFTGDIYYALANGLRKVRFDHNRQGTMTVSMQVFDLKWLPILLGGNWVDGSINWAIVKKTVVPTGGGTITLDSAPVTGTLSIFELGADKISHKSEFTADTTASAGKYAITGTTVTFDSSDAGKNIVVYYMKTVPTGGSQFDFKATTYPESFIVDGFAELKGSDNVVEFMQFYCGNAVPQSGFNISFTGGEATTVEAIFDLLPDEDNSLMSIKKLARATS